MKEFKMVERSPEVKEYNDLRVLANLRRIDSNLAKIGLRHSLYALSFYHEDTLIAMGRVVGDMGIIFYLQDVIVHPQYQNMGLGTKLINKLLAYIKSFKGESGEIMVGLMSSLGKESFYEKHGFFRRPNDNYGNGMTLIIK